MTLRTYLPTFETVRLTLSMAIIGYAVVTFPHLLGFSISDSEKNMGILLGAIAGYFGGIKHQQKH